MNMQTPDEATLAAAIAWLRARHGEIMATEREALALMDAGDIPGYTAKMHARAESLAALAKDAAPRLAALPEPLRGRLAGALKRFSQSAAMALRLDSVFYMSALLYPDEHKPGEPDNLALFISQLEARGEHFA
ncbi:hypothetical protein [uncultured Desulfovibrio sp.]|uniref:hypothetical protein n=1 Tax=uncultured Desulfovibrio sp. TaxID=167968 RepID=UPI002805257E|nr:hypothetical protein [uncultured Desulfovibrio sp.]